MGLHSGVVTVIDDLMLTSEVSRNLNWTCISGTHHAITTKCPKQRPGQLGSVLWVLINCSREFITLKFRNSNPITKRICVGDSHLCWCPLDQTTPNLWSVCPYFPTMKGRGFQNFSTFWQIRANHVGSCMHRTCNVPTVEGCALYYIPTLRLLNPGLTNDQQMCNFVFNQSSFSQLDRLSVVHHLYIACHRCMYIRSVISPHLTQQWLNDRR